MGGGSTGFVAVFTTKGYLRVYSLNGIPKMMLSIDGPGVSITAKDETIFVAYHNVSGTLCYMLLDVDRRYDTFFVVGLVMCSNLLSLLMCVCL